MVTDKQKISNLKSQAPQDNITGPAKQKISKIQNDKEKGRK